MAMLTYVAILGAVAPRGYGQILQIPQYTNVPSVAGYVQPMIIAAEVIHTDSTQRVTSQWYDWGGLSASAASAASEPMLVSTGDIIRVWTAFMRDKEDPFALAGIEFAGIDLMAWPVGHPTRPRPCDTLSSARVPPSPTNDPSVLSCWQFSVPPGEGDGSQRELGQAASTALLSREGPYTCIVSAPFKRPVCWGAFREGYTLANWPGYQPALAVPVKFLPEDLPPARQVTVNEYFGCILAEFGGNVLCWGGNNMTGTKITPNYGLMTYVPQPTDLAPSRFVTAAQQIACSIAMADDRLRCWGLLRGNPSYWADIVGPNGPPVASVSTGDELVCAVSRLGNFTCWGSGIATLAPLLPVNPMAFAALSVGFHSMCAIKAENSFVECWGGTCAAAERGCSLMPPYRAAAISVAGKVACMIRLDTKQPFCWKLPGHPNPSASIAAPASAQPVSSIAADQLYPCAIVAATRAVTCWGDGGTSPNTELYDSPLMTMPSFAATPLAALSIQYGLACGVAAATGDMKCWGRNKMTVVRVINDPGLYPLMLASAAVLVSAEDSLGVLVLASNGTLLDVSDLSLFPWAGQPLRPGDVDAPRLAWAAASPGAMCGIFRGNRSVTCVDVQRTTTTPNVGALPLNLPPSATVVVGNSHACSISIGTGELRCWGRFKYKGSNGTNVEPDVPDIPAGLPPVAQVAVGYEFTCVLVASTGEVRCFGVGTKGFPGPPAGMGPAIHISSYVYNLVCAIVASDRKPACWRYGNSPNFGQWPDGVESNPNRTLTAASAVATGVNHACMLDNALVPTCFGLRPDVLELSTPGNVFSEESRLPTAIHRPLGWTLRVCGRHPDRQGLSALPDCDTALGVVKYAAGYVLSASIVATSSLTDIYPAAGRSWIDFPTPTEPMAVAVNVEDLGSFGPIMASGPTNFLVKVCFWSPPLFHIDHRCETPEAKIIEYNGQRVSSSRVVADMPWGDPMLGGSVYVNVIGAGNDLKWGPLDEKYVPAISSVVVSEDFLFAEDTTAKIRVELIDAENSTDFVVIEPGDRITIYGRGFGNSESLFAEAGSESKNHPSCVYLTSLPSVNDPEAPRQEPWDCECNNGLMDFAGEGEVLPSYVLSWSMDEVHFLVPPGIMGVRHVAVCSFGGLAVHTVPYAVALPRLLAVSMSGGKESQGQVLIVRVGGQALRYGAPPGAGRLYMNTEVTRRGCCGDLARGAGWYLSPLAMDSEQGWPTSRLMLTIGPKCFASVGTVASLQPPAAMPDGTLCSDWSGWEALFDSNEGVFTARSLLPSGLLWANITLTLIDRTGMYLQVAGIQGSRMLPIAEPELMSADHAGLREGTSVLTLKGVGFPKASELASAEFSGWIRGQTGMQVRLVRLAANRTIAPVMCDSIDVTEGGSIITCVLPANVTVGAYTVKVMIGMNTLRTAHVDVLSIGCLSGHFGLENELCTLCSGPVVPSGSAECAGGMSDPHPLPGWHILNTTQSLQACPASRKALVGRPMCLVPCEPAEACAGSNACGEGYIDVPPYFRCGACLPGYCRLFSGECKVLSTLEKTKLIFGGLAVLLFLVLWFLAHKSGVEFSVLPLVVDFWHMISVVSVSPQGSKGVQLPSALHPLVEIASAISLNINVVDPECYVEGLPEPLMFRFGATCLLPIFLFVIVLLPLLPATLQAWWLKGVEGEEGDARRWKKVENRMVLLRFYLRALLFLYFIIVSSVLSVWNCVPSIPSEADGALYLASMPYERCWSSDSNSVQNRLQQLAFPALAFYVVGLPIAMACAFWFFHAEIVADQTAREKGGVSARADVRWVRATLSPLYAAYKPGKHWFSLINLLRKAAVCMLVLALNKGPSLQLTGAVVGIATGLTISAWSSPLLTPVWVKDKHRSWMTQLVDRNNLHAGFLGSAVLVVSIAAVWFDVAPGTPEAAYYPDADVFAALAVITVVALSMIMGMCAVVVDIRMQIADKRVKIPSVCAPFCRKAWLQRIDPVINEETEAVGARGEQKEKDAALGLRSESLGVSPLTLGERDKGSSVTDAAGVSLVFASVGSDGHTVGAVGNPLVATASSRAYRVTIMNAGNV